jgi:hypothetical protein
MNHNGAASFEPDRSISKNPFPLDPSNPPVVPHGRVKSQPENISESTKEKIAEQLPASKLLNSNPDPEPRRADKLHRTDSETQEVEEFVDAQS